MSYFNEEQRGHMDSLSKLTPEQKCFCGWEVLGRCYGRCNDKAPGKTRADAMRETPEFELGVHEERARVVALLNARLAVVAARQYPGRNQDLAAASDVGRASFAEGAIAAVVRGDHIASGAHDAGGKDNG